MLANAAPGSLGIEVLHLHPWKLAPDVAARAARIAARNVRSTIDTRARRRQPTSLVVMLDDYFLTGKPARVERIVTEAQDTIVAAAADVGLTIDLVVRESAMATVAERALALIEPGRVVDGILQANSPYRRFGVDEVPLWTTDDDGGRQWTCPYLAAVWQLVRLGLLALDGALVHQVHPDEPAAVGVATEETLTLLSSRYLATEAAVQAICATLASDALRNQVAAKASHLFVPAAESDEVAATGYLGPIRRAESERREEAMAMLGGARTDELLGQSVMDVLVIDADDLTRPYAAWEVLQSGPETLSVGRRIAPTLSDATEGLRAATDLADQEGFQAVLTTLPAAEVNVTTAEGFALAVASDTWNIALWTAKKGGPSAHRQADGGWLKSSTPAPDESSPPMFKMRTARLDDVDAIAAIDALEYLDSLSASLIANLITTFPAVVAVDTDGVVNRVRPGQSYCRFT